MAFFDNVGMLGPFFTSLFSIFFALVVLIFGKQPKPYMDEVFHIPQVQKYCEHRFNEWDPMITTLPGLYFCSWLFVEALAVVLKQDVKIICMPLFLRMINIVFNMGNIWVMYRILGKLNEMKASKSKNMKVLYYNLNYIYIYIIHYIKYIVHYKLYIYNLYYKLASYKLVRSHT